MPNRRIASLREAEARIGQRALSEVVVRACTGPMLDRGLPPYALPRRIAWRHAATASIASRNLARLVKAGCAEEASVAGLLHDVGKTVLSSVVPEAAAEAVSVAGSRHKPVWQAEVHVLGFHHGHVGGALLRAWGLPDFVADAVTFHHEPTETSNQLATVVSLADAAAHAVGVKVEFVNPFIQAAREVLESELGAEAQRGNLRLQKSACTTDEITALVGVTGTVSGMVLYSMSEATALGIVSRLMGQEFQGFDELAQSGIG